MAKATHYVAAESFVTADGAAYTKNESIVAASDPILKGKGMLKLFIPVDDRSRPRRVFREPPDLEPTFVGEEPPGPPEPPKPVRKTATRKKTTAKRSTAKKSAPKGEIHSPPEPGSPTPEPEKPAGLTTADMPGAPAGG